MSPKQRNRGLTTPMSYRLLRRGKKNVRAVVSLLACVFIGWPLATANAVRVWIDTDPAIGAPWREVDDAIALILAFRSPEMEIAGISTSYGNAPLARTTEIARDLVRRFAARDVPIFPGANAAADLGQRTRASDELARALRDERLTYVALAPLTNFATFQKLHPELVRRIDRIIFVGGQSSPQSLRFGRGRWLKVHDANALKDRAAVAQILASRVPLTLAPAELGARVMITPQDMHSLARAGKAGRFLSPRCAIWLRFWHDIVGEEGGAVFDALPMVTLMRGNLVETRKGVAKQTGELLFALTRNHGAPDVTVVTRISDRAHTVIIRRLIE